MLYGVCLIQTLNGYAQLTLLFLLNVIGVILQASILKLNLYKSKVKITGRFLNSIALIILEILILAYNLSSY